MPKYAVIHVNFTVTSTSHSTEAVDTKVNRGTKALARSTRQFLSDGERALPPGFSRFACWSAVSLPTAFSRVEATLTLGVVIMSLTSNPSMTPRHATSCSASNDHSHKQHQPCTSQQQDGTLQKRRCVSRGLACSLAQSFASHLGNRKPSRMSSVFTEVCLLVCSHGGRVWRHAAHCNRAFRCVCPPQPQGQA